MRVKNVKGSSKVSGKAPSPYNSWLQYWEVQSGTKLKDDIYYTCPACREKFKKSNFDGAHVQKVNNMDRNWYITPLCSGCNHREIEFEVHNDDLVPVPSNLK
ncbi:MAG: hypothetical protein LUC91_08595 [Prevotella sp.]|nr:hypothetical protein [Prevotella sp.]